MVAKLLIPRECFIYGVSLKGKEDPLFAWFHLPPIASHLPSTGGKIRSRLDDFVVTEIPKYLPNGQGPNVYAFVEKRGLTTDDLVSHLRFQGVSTKDVGVADRKALTEGLRSDGATL